MNFSGAIRGEPLRYSAPLQSKYVSELEKLTQWVISETNKTVKSIYRTDESKKYFAEDASIASIARIKMNDLDARIDRVLRSKAKTLANRMVSESDKVSKSSLHSSLSELSGGLSIKTNINSSDIQNAFTASVNENVDLIKTIGAQYRDAARGAVNRSIQQGGQGLNELIPQIKKMLNKKASQELNKAKNVALDQTRKAYNGLNAARMEKIGVTEFEWVHSGGGQSARKLHITPYPAGLNHGIFDVNDPPVVDERTGERGLPGSAINCKCVMRPLIKFDEGEPDDI